MGRPERPVDPGDSPVHRFAADLRALRRAAGNPTYRELGVRCRYSPSVLSRAASGQALPTLEVTLGFVNACNGDPQAWRIRWKEVAPGTGDRATTAHTADPAATPTATPAVLNDVEPPQLQGRPAGPRWSTSRRRWWLTAWAVGFAVLAAGAAVFCLTPGHTGSHPEPPGPSIVVAGQAQSGGLPAQPVADGVDPKRSGCAPDGVTIDSVSLMFPAQRLAGSVELRYSPHCKVAWTRFVPAPTGRAAGDTVTVEVFRPADGARVPFTITYGDEAVYSDVLVVARGCVVARAWVVTSGQQSGVATSACLSGPRPGDGS